jgi:hypothetical protein
MIKWLAGRVWFWKIEGIAPLNGINIYKKDDEGSSGFIIKLGAFHFKCRYSKRTRKLIVKAYWQRPSYEQYSI